MAGTQPTAAEPYSWGLWVGSGAIPLTSSPQLHPTGKLGVEDLGDGQPKNKTDALRLSWRPGSQDQEGA